LIIWRTEGGGECLAPTGGEEYLEAREKDIIWRLGGGEYWAQAGRGGSGGWEEVSSGHRQGDKYLVARKEQEEVAMGPSGGKKPLLTD